MNYVIIYCGIISIIYFVVYLFIVIIINYIVIYVGLFPLYFLS